MQRRLGRPAGGFTLVELMVVIAIIAVLVGLLVVGLGGVMTTGKNARIKLEVAALAKALERYKLEYGDYPPDFTSGNPTEEVNRHLARKFRYRLAAEDMFTPPVAIQDRAPKPGNIAQLEPTEALYFWLRGFHADRKHPLRGPDPQFTVPDERTPLFEFDQARLTDRDNDGHPEYVPQDGLEVPFIYYMHKNAVGINGEPTKNYLTAVQWSSVKRSSNFHVAGPYRSSSAPPLTALTDTAAAGSFGSVSFGNVGFAEAVKFQVVSAGLDGEYISQGAEGGGVYPEGLGYSDAELDNITNFSQGSTLEDDVP